MLVIEQAAGRFQVRASALVRHHGRVLLHRTVPDDFWTLPGGRVELGEDTATAVVRELREELGVAARSRELAFVVESFFAHGGRRCHEIGFVYFVELEAGAAVLDAARVHRGLEAHRALEFRWFDEARLRDVPLWPAFLREADLSTGPFPRALVERETGETGEPTRP